MDAIVACYAIYHLCRPAGCRTPASSASYHWFALLMDTAFIPFFVYAVFYARANYIAPAGSDGRWTTVMGTADSANAILLTSWITATILAGTHLISAVLDIVLGCCFRKIVMMPPDCNPLVAERSVQKPSSKSTNRHKHKTSDMDGTTAVGGKTDPTKYPPSSKFSYASSQASSHNVRQSQEQQSNMVPFAATREYYSPRSHHESVRPRSSHQSIHSRNSRYTADRTSKSEHSPSTKRASSSTRYQHDHALDQSPTLPPLPRHSSLMHNHENHSDTSSSSSSSASMTPEQRDILKDNWFTVDERQPDMSRELASAQSSNHLGLNAVEPQYEQIYADSASPTPDDHSQHYHDVHDHPLRSHQPDLPAATYVPLPSHEPVGNAERRVESSRPNVDRDQEGTEVGRALTMGSSIYTESIMSPPEESDPLAKNRYYGALGSSNIHLVDVPSRDTDAYRNASTGAEMVERSGLAATNGRMVSGKIVEEGRGGWAMRRREPSGAQFA